GLGRERALDRRGRLPPAARPARRRGRRRRAAQPRACPHPLRLRRPDPDRAPDVTARSGPKNSRTVERAVTDAAAKVTGAPMPTFGIGLAAACLGVFLGALDQTVVATLLPPIVEELQIPFTRLHDA